MLDNLRKALCGAALQAYGLCVVEEPPFAWVFSEGGQLFLSTLLGAVIGAIVAGVIQFLISRTEFNRNVRQSVAEHRRTRRQQASDQLKQNKTTALLIGVKAMTLTNQMYSTMGLILRSVADAKATGFNSNNIAEKMVPMSGISREALQFSSEELAFLFGSNEAELANKLILLNEKNRSLTDSIHTYSQTRMALPEIVAKENVPLIKIRLAELSDLANGVCQGLEEDFRFALELMEELPKAFDRALKQDSFFNADIPGLAKSRLATFKDILQEHGIETLD